MASWKIMKSGVVQQKDHQMSVGMMEIFDTEDKVVRYVRSKFAITIIEMKSQQSFSLKNPNLTKRRCTAAASFSWKNQI